MVGAVPKEWAASPVDSARKHIESLAGDAAKEAEYAVRFGNDKLRWDVARDILAMNGITTKEKAAMPAPPMIFVTASVPMTRQGAPVLPFSNAQRLAQDTRIVDSPSFTATLADTTRVPNKKD